MKKTYLVLIVAVIALILIFSCVKGLISDFKNGKNEAAREEKEKLEEAEKQEKKEPSVPDIQTGSKGTMKITINPNPVAKNGRSEANFGIFNSSDNQYPQIAEIYVKSNMAPVYLSQLIEPGECIESDYLETELPKGTYICIVGIHAIDGSSAELMDTYRGEITLTVLE